MLSRINIKTINKNPNINFFFKLNNPKLFFLSLKIFKSLIPNKKHLNFLNKYHKTNMFYL